MKLPHRFFGSKASYDPKAHLLRCQELHAKYPLNDIDKCNAFTLDIFKEVYGKEAPYLVVDEIEELILLLFDQNKIYCPEVPTSQDREILTLRERELASHDRIKIARAALVQFLKALPLPASVYEQHKPTPDEQVAEALGKTRPSKTGPTVALSTFIPDLAEHISHAIHVVANTKHGEHRIFPSTWYDISMNIDALSGSTTKYILPSEYKDDPCHYVGGTPFAALFYAQVPFVIPRKTWASHGIILAPPNHGKTQLLGSLVAGFLNEADPVGCFVLDPHGDLFSALRVRVPPSRLVILDPDTAPPPLNFLDFGTSTEAQTLQTFSYLMSSLSGGLSDKQQGLVPYVLALLRQIPDATLDTMRVLMNEKVKAADKSQFWRYMQQLEAEERDYFVDLFYTGRMGETKEAISWKLYAALSNKTFRKMFTAKTNSFDAAAAMRDRKVVLVKGSENTLGEAGAPIVLQYIVAQVMLASFKRANIPEKDRHLCMLIIDEAKHVFNDQTERILTECRKWNLGFLAASQLISQIPENVRTAIYGATAVKISGPVADGDAEQLRKEMYCTKDFIRGMKAVERSHADWAFYVTGLTDKAVRVRVPYGVLEAMPKLNNDSAFVHRPIVPQTHEGPSNPEIVSAPKKQVKRILDDANGRIDKALRLLTPALQVFIETELRRVHSTNWRQTLSVAQGTDVQQQPLDAYAAFKTMLDNWQSCFKETLNIKARTDVSMALEARNAISHATSEISAVDAISYLTAIRDIALAVSASSVADTVKAFIDDQIKAAAIELPHSTDEPAEPVTATTGPLIKPGKKW